MPPKVEDALANETTPLTVADGAEKKTKKTSIPGLQEQRQRRQKLLYSLLAIVGLTILGLSSLMVYHQRIAHDHGGSAATGNDMTEVTSSATVTITSDGEYTVLYAQDITADVDISLAELATVMLPRWYQASVMAASLNLNTSSMDPSTVEPARKCLLTTRDLLDVFGPIYPHSQWKEVRRYFKEGYELAGAYQDLDHAKIAYDPALWEERRGALLTWKEDFEAYQQTHDVVDFLQHSTISKRSRCEKNFAKEKESHLFWSDGGIARAPCGKDKARKTLKRLAQAQLQNALLYFNIMSPYEHVLSVDHQEIYHNFRKELRSFLDVYHLLGFILFPENSDETSTHIATLLNARKLLGEINDNWTAYDVYQAENTHLEQQQTLQLKIDAEWKDFQSWASTHDLRGAIQDLVILLED